MFDLRDEIIALAEKTLHSFVTFRFKELNIENTWKTGIKDFVVKSIPNYRANYTTVYNFLHDHDEQELVLEQLDITALVSLIEFYFVRGKNYSIYTVHPESKQLFQNHVLEFRSLRNTFDHYTKDVKPAEEDKFYFDQLFYTASIAQFAILVMKYRGQSEEWKEIYHKAKAIERKLGGERWLALDTNNNMLQNDEDMSTILFYAEQGITEAQIKAGKAYYHGERVKRDEETAYIWIHKAAMKQNPEAEYYLGRCYGHGFGVEQNFEAEYKWYEMSAKQGFAPAQYEIGSRNIAKTNKTEDEAKETYYWLKQSADQDYPAAVWNLGLCYAFGIGINKDPEQAEKLYEKSAKLGNLWATESLARESEKKRDYDKAIAWLKLAETQGKKNVQWEIRRIEKKKRESEE